MRFRALSVVTAMISLLASSTMAATSAPGVNLRWDQCYGDGGVWNKTFACDTNTGTASLVGSFELSAPSFQTTQLSIYVDLRSASPALPAWWGLKTGACRPTSLAASLLPPAGAANCVDWASGNAVGGIAAYAMGEQGPDHVQIRAAAAVPPSAFADLVPGLEYFAFRFTINYAKTVGTGACAGCDIPVCIFLSRIQVEHADPTMDVHLEQGANYLGSQYVTWQGGYPTDVERMCDPRFSDCRHSTRFSCVPYDVTPTRGSTWGLVKSLYR